MDVVLITGAGGFVGKALIDHLMDRYPLVGTGRIPAIDVFDDLSGEVYYEMDITQPKEIEKIFELANPSIVIHAAAMSKPDECELNREKAFAVNTTAVAYLLEASAKFKSHFIFLSTDFVFDGKRGMYREDDIPGPVNYYGETKLQAEELVKQYPYGWSVIRTVLVYGSSEGTRDNILTSAAKVLKKGEQMQIVNDQVRTPTHVDDLCKAINAAIENRAQGIFHVSGKDVLTPYEMVIATARHLGLDEKLVTPVSQTSFTQQARRPLKTGFDISKARRELGYEPVSFEEGLKLTFVSQAP
jgi:dTDP-4-dehydrorhamnose reductase